MQIINRNCNLSVYLLFLFGPNYFDTRRLGEQNRLGFFVPKHERNNFKAEALYKSKNNKSRIAQTLFNF